MIDKVKVFPIERYYYLESEDFLIHREKFYFRKDKTIKLNSFWLGVSRLKVNNDKLLYLFNGLRGYYDVRTRYIKNPKIMENRVPLNKKIFVNDYLVKKYKYSDLLIYSLNNFNRPTIRLKKDDSNKVYYSFHYRLVEYLNKKREILNSRMANMEFNKTVKDLKYIGFKFALKPRKKYKGLRRLKYLPSIALGWSEIFLLNDFIYLNYLIRQREKANKITFDKYLYKVKRRKKRGRGKKKGLINYNKYYKTPAVLRLLFVAARRFLKRNRIKFKNKVKIKNLRRIKKILKRKKRFLEKRRLGAKEIKRRLKEKLKKLTEKKLNRNFAKFRKIRKGVLAKLKNKAKKRKK